MGGVGGTLSVSECLCVVCCVGGQGGQKAREFKNSKKGKAHSVICTTCLLAPIFVFWVPFRTLYHTSPASRKDQKIEAYFAASNHQAKTSSNVLQYCRQELGQPQSQAAQPHLAPRTPT